MFSATWVTKQWKTSENTFCFSSTICSEYNYCAICKWKVAEDENLNNFAEESNSQISLLEEKQEIINFYQRRMLKVTTCGISLASSPFHCLSQFPNRATYIVVSQEKKLGGWYHKRKEFPFIKASPYAKTTHKCRRSHTMKQRSKEKMNIKARLQHWIKIQITISVFSINYLLLSG